MVSANLPLVLAARIALGLVVLVGCSTQSRNDPVGSLSETADGDAMKSGAGVILDASIDEATRDTSLDGVLPGATGGGNVCSGVTCLLGEHFDVAACRCVSDTAAQGSGRDGSSDTKLSGANGDGNVCGGVTCFVGQQLDLASCDCVPVALPDWAARDGRPDEAPQGANGAGNLCGGVTCLVGEHFDVAECRCLPSAAANGSAH